MKAISDTPEVYMPLEEEMRNEVERLEKEMEAIDRELEKLRSRIAQLDAMRKKAEHDLRILKYHFGEEEGTEFQTTLAGLLEEKI